MILKGGGAEGKNMSQLIYTPAEKQSIYLYINND